MITGDLEAELVRSMQELTAAGDLPAGPLPVPGRSWRPDPAGDPASYATSLPLELAPLAARPAAELAATLAVPLMDVPWIAAARPSHEGYLTVTVTEAALAALAGRITLAGAACARSNLLHGTTVVLRPWPDPGAAATWQQAWRAQADAMTSRFALAAGAISIRERGTPGADAGLSADSPVRVEVDYFGVGAVCYRLARTLPGRTWQLEQPFRPETDPGEAVHRAHAEAASTLRWAADLDLDRGDPGSDCPSGLRSDVERRLLGLLSWLPVRVASSARRRRPDEVPRYLEQVAAAWTSCRQDSPALPFGGAAASSDRRVVCCRLMLADATRTVLAAGLALTGLTPRSQI